MLLIEIISQRTETAVVYRILIGKLNSKLVDQGIYMRIMRQVSLTEVFHGSLQFVVHVRLVSSSML